MRRPSSLKVVTVIFAIVVVGTFVTLTAVGIESASDSTPPSRTSTTAPAPPTTTLTTPTTSPAAP